MNNNLIHFRCTAFLLFLCIASLLPIVPAWAQQENERRITGQVTDETHEPMIGASILVVGTTIGVITDLNGNYTLHVPEIGRAHV